MDAAGGRIDALVNTAGGVAGQVMRPVEEVSDADWREIFAVNLDGAFHFTRAAAPAMKRAGRGAIVNISSGAGRSYSLTGIQAYASAKAGLIGFTRQTARELGRHGIRVNSVAPGFIRSNPATERQWEAMGADGQARLVESIALHRLGTPEEIARAVVFFVSDDAALRHRPDHQRRRRPVDARLTRSTPRGGRDIVDPSSIYAREPWDMPVAMPVRLLRGKWDVGTLLPINEGSTNA